MTPRPADIFTPALQNALRSTAGQQQGQEKGLQNHKSAGEKTHLVDKIIWHLFYVTLSAVHHFVPIGELKLELQSRNARTGSKSVFFVLCDLEI